MITTESSNANALRMAKLLIQNKLAACVSIKQIFSIYKWDDDIEETKEFEITIKSKLEFKDCLIDFVNKNSTYDIPQIIYKKYHAEMKYYDWLNKTIGLIYFINSLRSISDLDPNCVIICPAQIEAISPHFLREQLFINPWINPPA